MNKDSKYNLFLLLILLALLLVISFAIFKINKEGPQCVANPLGYAQLQIDNDDFQCICIKDELLQGIGNSEDDYLDFNISNLNLTVVK